MKNQKFLLPLTAAFVFCLLLPQKLPGQSDSALANRIHAITARPLYQHSIFGVAVYSLDESKVVYSLNGDQFFTPASTTKLLTEGTALGLLGPDYRFHTRIYRTGPITANGTLKGDLVLVASGDPNLSGRIQPDDTLAFENEDHTYAGSVYAAEAKAVPGDPLLVIHGLAAQVTARGIRRIDGNVLVDVSLFPEGQRELGTAAVISPVSVNDNLVDVTISPADKQGAPAGILSSPATAYVTFINQISTGPSGSKPNVNFAKDVANPDGSHTVTLNGNFPLGMHSTLYAYRVPQPSRFAQMTLVEALREKGVQVSSPKPDLQPDFKTLAESYTPENLIAEHVSPPLAQETKVTLKVSQNLHASMMPFILGAVLSGKHQDAEQAGFNLENSFLKKAGLDLSGASQGDGAGGSQAAYFTPDFMVHYLAYISRQKYSQAFEKALPVLGRDGSLWNIQVNSPAAGHVLAKTGTFTAPDLLNNNLMLIGKGLAGYITTADGRHLAFAAYLNHASVAETGIETAGQALGEIAAAIYSSPAK